MYAIHTQGIEHLVKLLQRRNVAIYLISGGFREIIIPIANLLNIPRDHIFANRMNWWVPAPGAVEQGCVQRDTPCDSMPCRCLVLVNQCLFDLGEPYLQGADAEHKMYLASRTAKGFVCCLLVK
jgi:hypothetical protein